MVETLIKISVIVPVYNVADYLDDCLQSIISQTMSEIEIICVNDGSTDASPVILNKYQALDKRIKTINKQNAGLGAARNTGVGAARGKYLLFVDSDDWIAPNACEHLYNMAEHHQLQILQATYQMSRHEQKYNKELLSASDEILYDSGMAIGQEKYNLSPFNWDKLWQRDFFIKHQLFNIEGILYEDVLTSMRGFMNATKLGILDFPFYYYRQRKGSIFNQTPGRKHIESLRIVAKEAFELIDQNNFWSHASFVKAYMRILERLRVDVSEDKHGKELEKDVLELVDQQRSHFRRKLKGGLPFDFIVFQVIYLPSWTWPIFHKTYFFMKNLMLNFKK